MTVTSRSDLTISDLNRHGYALVEGLRAEADVTAAVAEMAPHFEDALESERKNKTARIHSRILVNAPILQDLMVDPFILEVINHFLSPNCARYQLSSLQGIKVYSGANCQALHRDDDIFRLPHPHPVFQVNVMWAITDFTSENGATRVVPGSHNWPSGQHPPPQSEVSATMPMGSALLWLGSTWHGAGANQTDQPRIGLYTGYSLGWLRQEETLYLALPPDTVRTMPKNLQRLVGYELKGTMTLGWLDGRDPREVLELDG